MYPGRHWLGVGGRIQVHTGQDGIADEAAHYFGTTPGSARDSRSSASASFCVRRPPD